MVREGRGSVSLLQRSLGIGYGRAARLIDFMAEDGIVGPYNGSQAREILHHPRTMGGNERPWLGSRGGCARPGPAKPQRNNKILMTPADEKPRGSGAVRTVKAVDDEEEADEEEMDAYATEADEPPFDEDPPEDDALEDADEEESEDDWEEDEDSDQVEEDEADEETDSDMDAAELEREEVEREDGVEESSGDTRKKHRGKTAPRHPRRWNAESA